MNLKIWFNAWLALALVLAIMAYAQAVSANPVVPAESVEDLLTTKDHAPINLIHSQDYREVRCMSTAVWYESGHEPRLGKIAVARVIQNRVRGGFADSACAVVQQRTNSVCQFSWACGSYHLISAAECAECWQVAVEVLAQDRHQNFLKNALYFHATYMDPAWAGVVPVKVIGNHKFYRKF